VSSDDWRRLELATELLDVKEPEVREEEVEEEETNEAMSVDAAGPERSFKVALTSCSSAMEAGVDMFEPGLVAEAAADELVAWCRRRDRTNTVSPFCLVGVCAGFILFFAMLNMLLNN